MINYDILCAMDNLLELIGQYIKTNRISMDFTQAELAESAGVSLVTLRRAERGESVSLETLFLLMEIFGDQDSFVKLFASSVSSPLSLLSNDFHSRQRVRKSKSKVAKKSWTWGDDESN